MEPQIIEAIREVMQSELKRELAPMHARLKELEARLATIEGKVTSLDNLVAGSDHAPGPSNLVSDNPDSIQWNELWQQALTVIASKLSKPSFNTWFSGTTVQSKEQQLIIVSEEQLKSEWLETRYLKLISETVSQLTGNPSINLKFISR